MLLFTGWNLQAVKPQEWLSFTTRRHCPDAGFHTLAVPSKDAESIKSLVIDQSKSNKKSKIQCQWLLLESEVVRGCCWSTNVSCKMWIPLSQSCIGSLKRTFDFFKGSKWKVYETLRGNLIYFVQNFSLTECRVYKTCILLRGERHSDHLIILHKGWTQRPAQAFKPILSTRPQLFKGQIFTG